MAGREHLRHVIGALRQAQLEVLAPMRLAEVVDVLDAMVAHLETGALALQCADGTGQRLAVHPITLGALLASLRREAVWELLREELGDPAVLDGFRPRTLGGWRRATGPQVIAHVLAGNTPLLSWPSLAAALLVRSASLVKLSSDDPHWPRVFQEALAAVRPELARCIALEQWPGGTRELDEVLCTETDTVVAYGSDAALASLRALTPMPVPFHGYGHRVSVGLVLQGANEEAAAAGLARDVLLYDQGGCLSAAMVIVEGEAGDAIRFGERLAAALERQADDWGLPPRGGDAAAGVRAARDAALFAAGARVWGDPGLRWTVLFDPHATPEASHGSCVVPVHALGALQRLPEVLAPLRRHLQGAALAAPEERRQEVAMLLAEAGVNRICDPGALQAPPFSWHHDGRPVLAGLLRWTDLDAM